VAPQGGGKPRPYKSKYGGNLMNRLISFISIPAFLFCFISSSFAEEESYSSLAQKATKQAQKRDYAGAYKIFKKALFLDNKQVDLYYNLSMIGAGIKSCSDAVIYMTAYLYLTSQGAEAKEIRSRKESCEKLLKNPGTLTITSEPAGIEITLDNALVGKTPITGLTLEKGNYKISLRHLDWEDIDMNVTVTEKNETRAALPLVKRKAFGQLEIAVTPPDGVKIFLDDKPAGETPLKDKFITLETKEYLLKLVKDGYDQWVRYVTINRDKVTKVEVTLEKIQQKPALPPVK
jgi:hypothetical protein